MVKLRIRDAVTTLVGVKPSRASWFQEAGEEINRRGVFVGCQLPWFEWTSKDLFYLAALEGLTKQSAVLEIGAGCLRTGYWFIRYLEPSMYFGIEPSRDMLAAGLELLLGDLAHEKNPRFDHNADFDFTVFGTQFDFVVAFSIWSHASKRQIERMLDQFVLTGKPGAKLITCWRPARNAREDYTGDDWVGQSHLSNRRGSVAHDRGWIAGAVEARGLSMTLPAAYTTLGLSWLVVTNASASPSPRV